MQRDDTIYCFPGLTVRVPPKDSGRHPTYRLGSMSAPKSITRKDAARIMSGVRTALVAVTSMSPDCL